MTQLTCISSWKSFGGLLSVYDHDSPLLDCRMRFAAFRPPQADNHPVPVLWYLSGLTCSWANVMEKSGVQQYAAQHGLMIIAPDTSPRGPEIPDDPAYDLGQGAGFYLTATNPPWDRNYRMDQYVTSELPAVVSSDLPEADLSRQGIFGHSMGGHGAITLFFRNPGKFRSCSAFSPITSPAEVPWGQKAFEAYLGTQKNQWEAYDATCLARLHPPGAKLLIDTGTCDPFLETQLQPEKFIEACRQGGHELDYRLQEGYGHDYYFVASFMADHIAYHAGLLAR